MMLTICQLQKQYDIILKNQNIPTHKNMQTGGYLDPDTQEKWLKYYQEQANLGNVS